MSNRHNHLLIGYRQMTYVLGTWQIITTITEPFRAKWSICCAVGLGWSYLPISNCLSCVERRKLTKILLTENWTESIMRLLERWIHMNAQQCSDAMIRCKPKIKSKCLSMTCSSSRSSSAVHVFQKVQFAYIIQFQVRQERGNSKNNI